MRFVHIGTSGPSAEFSFSDAEIWIPARLEMTSLITKAASDSRISSVLVLASAFVGKLSSSSAG